MPKRFNISAVIEAYNLEYQKQISPNKTWGLDYLQPENLGFLYDADCLLDEILKAPTTIDRARTIQLRYKNGKIGAALVERLNWEQRQEKVFSQREFWRYLEEKKAAQNELRLRRINALKELWQLPLLPLHSNDALVRLILIIKTVLVHLKFAQTELNNTRRIPQPIREKYQQYLSELAVRFTFAREQVTQTMFVRLQAANASVQKAGNYYGDTISYTVDRLQQENIVLKRPKLTAHRHLFSPHTFQVFHQTVEQHGSSVLKQQLRNFSWFREHSGSLPSTTMTIARQHCIVPRALAQYAPSWKGWPKWLFKDRHARANFFIEEQFTFAQLKIPLPDLPLTVEAEQSYLQRIFEQEDIAKQALLNAKTKKASWRQSGFKKLLSKWQQLNEERLNVCAEKRLLLLEAFSQQPVSVDLNVRTQRWQFVRTIINQFQQQKMSPKLQERLGDVSKRLQQNLGQHPFTFAADLLIELADEKPLQLKDRKHLLKTLKMLDLGEFTLDDVVTPETAKLAAQQILIRVKRQFQLEPFPWHEILVNSQLIQLLGNKDQKQQLQVQLEKMILHHFDQLSLMPESMARKDAAQFEQFVIQIGNEVWQPFFRKLEGVRTEKSWLIYLHKYRVQAERLALIYTDQAVEEDAKRVEQYFTQVIEELTQDQAEVRVLSDLPKKLIAEQKTDLTTITLAPYEKILAGLQGTPEPQRQSIRSGAEAMAAAKLGVSKIKSAQSLSEKEKIQDQLQKDIRQRLPTLEFFQQRYRVPTITIPSSENIHYDFTRATI